MSLESGSTEDESYAGICSTCSSSDKATTIVAAFEPYEIKPPASGQDQNEIRQVMKTLMGSLS